MFGKKKAEGVGDGLVSGLFGNQTIAKLAFGKAKDWFAKEGITAVVVRIDPTATETDGIRMEAHKSAIAIVSGIDLVKIARMNEWPDDLNLGDWQAIKSFLEERKKEATHGD